MKFVLAFNGSRGDVQPAIALGTELSTRGHEVVLAVPPNLVDFALSSGLPTRPYGLDTRELLESEVVSRDLKSANPITRLRAVSEITLRGGRQMQQELLELSAGADAIVGGSAGQERAFNVALARQIPYVPLHFCPIRRNGEVSPLTQFGINPPSPLSRASWAMLEQILWRASRSAENTLAEDLGLENAHAPAATRIAAAGHPEIQAYDSALFPGLAGEWGARRPLVGFLNLAPDTRRRMGDGFSDDDLLTWLDAGPPPLYVGFGSMAVADPDALADIITTATTTLGLRVLMATGWSGLSVADHGDRIYSVPAVDHDTILPRCAGAVHHGGAGSVAATLRAGLPTLVYWLGADQPLWGRQVTRLGAGASAPLKKIDVHDLIAALEKVLTHEFAGAAHRIAGRLVTSDAAVDEAASVVERAVR